MDVTPLPLEEARALDPALYTRPDVYAFELLHVLRPHWQVVGASEGLSAPGDVIAREIGGVPVVAVRGADGALRGFHNICRHRAGPVATCDARGQKSLRCAYHGWTYGLDGRLRSAPEMDGARDFDRDEISLDPIDVLEWNGLVFARVGPGTPFADLYAGVEEAAGSSSLADLVHHTARVYEVASNWKIYVDNYLEGYHLPFVHPSLTRVVDYKAYTTELGRWWSVQRSPVEECGPYGAGEGLYFFVYPNVMLNVMPGRLQTNRVLPTGLDTCRVEFDFYYAPGAERRAEDDLRFSDQVQEEDRSICESVQRSLGSGAYRPGRLSPTRERGVWHWQNLLRDAYRRGLDAGALGDAPQRTGA